MTTVDTTLRALQAPAHCTRLSDISFGELMTIREFRDLARAGMFTPYDGNGHWANAELNLMDRTSDIWSDWSITPNWATHIVWFNK